MNLGLEIRRLRIARRMSLQDLEKASGIPATSICCLERGRRPNPEWRRVELLLCALGARLKIVVRRLARRAKRISTRRQKIFTPSSVGMLSELGRSVASIAKELRHPESTVRKYLREWRAATEVDREIARSGTWPTRQFKSASENGL